MNIDAMIYDEICYVQIESVLACKRFGSIRLLCLALCTAVEFHKISLYKLESNWIKLMEIKRMHIVCVCVAAKRW